MNKYSLTWRQIRDRATRAHNARLALIFLIASPCAAFALCGAAAWVVVKYFT
jgi:hypothetical protein